MDTFIITCKTLEEELTLAMKNTGLEYPVEYIESGLHERPKKLAEAVEEKLAEVKADRILMCIGQCGNALIGLNSGPFEIVLPKVDDCLSLLIGSTRKKAALSLEDRAFFLTKGWLKGESTIMSQFKRSVEEYGEDIALSIIETLYANYRTMGLIDTGTSPIDELWAQTEEVSWLLKFDRKVYPGTIAYIEQLLTGPWDDGRFIVKKPGETISAGDYQGM
jgi:hypothetical protein